MRLHKRSIKGREFRHPLFKAGLKPLTEDEIPALVEKIKTQDQDACDYATLGLIVLGLQIVGRYLAVMGSDRLADDLAGAALEGIVDAIHRVSIGKVEIHSTFRGFVVSNIHRFISDELDRQELVRVPGRTIRRKLAEGDEFLRLQQVSLGDPSIVRRHVTQSGIRDFEIKELLDRVLENDQQREILRLRQEGMTDQEVADALGLSKTTVFVIRRDLETRFLELFYG